MPGIDGVDSKAPQFFDTGIRCRKVVQNGIENWYVYVIEQIAAKQVASGCHDSNGAS